MNFGVQFEPHHRRWLLAAIALLQLLTVCGCNQQAIPPVVEKAASAPIMLRLAVVDDPALATSLRKVRGEWQAQAGADLEILELSAHDASTAEKLPADAVIYPISMLGTLAERKLIRPFNATWLAGDPFEASDLLLSADALELSWDGQRYAVPLGEPAFVLAYRADLLEKLGKQPPRTWEEYQKLATLLSDRAKLGVAAQLPNDWSGAVEPLASPWAGEFLLARAAAYAKHRDYFSVLFDRETMTPLIAGPPFVKALEEIVAVAKTARVDPTKLSPADTVRLLSTGHAGMAFGWPNAAFENKSDAVKPTDGPITISFAELPGAAVAYNLGHKSWEDRRGDEQQCVTLRGIAGLAGSVARGSEHAEAAFGLLAWLAGKRWSAEVLPSSPSAAPLHQSQLEFPTTWIGNGFDQGIAKVYGETLAEAFRRKETLMMPRIPGVADYLAALDKAVLASVKNKTPPQQALDEAAAQWTQITERLGKQQQMEAYRRSLTPVR